MNELAGMSSTEANKSVAVNVEVKRTDKVLGDVAGCTFHILTLPDLLHSTNQD